MALESNALTTFSAIGNREQLANAVYQISPTETPFLSQVAKKSKASATYVEWQTSSLAAAQTTGVLEGDAVTIDSASTRTRLGNYCHILDRTARVTGTQEAVDTAGVSSEMAFQVAQAMANLKRDVEKTLLDNNVRVAGNATTARELSGMPCWMSNVDKASDATAPTGDGTDIHTDGTARAFTESQLASVIEDCWDDGGNPTIIMVGGFNKRQLSKFSGGSTRIDKGEDKRLTAAVDVYVSDFGDLKVVPNRFSPADMAFVLDPGYWEVASLRDFRSLDIARTGDSMAKQCLWEGTLISRQGAASGMIADLTTS